MESEPARAGYQLLMLFIIANAKFRNRTVAFGALVVAELVVLRATSGLILTGAFVGFLAVGVLRGRPKLTPVLLLGVLAVGGFAYTSNPKIEEIVDETIDRGPQGFEDSILATSGGRYLAFKDSITDIVTQPLGRGADPSFAGNDLELLQKRTLRRPRGPRLQSRTRRSAGVCHLEHGSHLWHRHGLSGCMGDPARPVQRQTTRLHAKLLVCDPGRLDLWTLG